ncbi:related to high affinity methionine permease [Cephalotrichum gorgonifer]|uniref:Related to high affinity methionine permease n=1 Tax=Cephalotrichum gorgonifer TaxID=2041049 RepID=A0AAE8MUF3_9PEZI|nr:related to high affinity methionine permease [Cephalotrichum gorgonifer]
MAGLESEADNDGETRPLLQDNDGLSRASSSSTLAKGPEASSDEEAGSITTLPPSRSAEDDVLPETSPLGRTVTWGSAYIIVISRVIGSGIFATPGSIVRAVGSPGLALLLWVAGAVAAACGLAVSLEYGCMLPRSGGHKVYLEFTYRHPRFLASTLIATHIILLGFSASNCVIFSRYTLFALGLDADVSDFWRKAVAVGLLTVITFIHGCLPKLGIRIQNWLGWMKVGIIIFMILSGIYVVLFREASDVRADRSLPVWDDLWEGSVWNWGTISVAYFQIIYSYSGLDNVNNILNEVKDPIRTLPSITSTALFTAASLYTLINVAYFLVVPIDEIKGSGEMIAALFFERLFGHHIGGIVLPLAIALSAVGNVMVVIFAQARLKQEIARQGFLPFSELLSSTRPFGSPLGGLLLHFIPSFLVIVVPPSSDVYSFILSVEGYPGQFISVAIGGGLIWLRFKRPDLQRPFKAWIPAVLVTLGLSSSLIVAPFFAPGGFPAYAIVGLSM